MAASLPIPIPATPRSYFVFLEGFQYQMFESRLDPERVVGLPLRELPSGERAPFVDPEVPIVTLNLAAPAIRFPDVTGRFLRVVPYTAMIGPDDTTIIIAPVAEQTHRHGFYVLHRASLVQLPPSTALGGFRLEISDQYTAKEERTVHVSWRPTAAGVMSRQRLCQILSSHDMVESILKCGTFEARVTFRSPYAVSSVLGGAGRVRYAFWDGIRRDELLLKSDKRMLEMLEDRPDRDSRLLITFDDQLHYAELHNFFNRFGTVNHVILLDADVGQPRGAVVLFHNPEAVRNTLRGAQVLTLYHGEIEIRVRPYPTA